MSQPGTSAVLNLTVAQMQSFIPEYAVPASDDWKQQFVMFSAAAVDSRKAERTSS